HGLRYHFFFARAFLLSRAHASAEIQPCNKPDDSQSKNYNQPNQNHAQAVVFPSWRYRLNSSRVLKEAGIAELLLVAEVFIAPLSSRRSCILRSPRIISLGLFVVIPWVCHVSSLF